MAILNLGKVIIAGTLVTSITIGAVSWSGSSDLQTIKDKANHMKQTITDMSTNADAMLSKFNIFKSDAETTINAKIQRINDLLAQIDQLKAEGTANKSDLDALADEVNRLEGEVNKANTEVAQTSSDVSTTDSDAQTIANGSKTASDMDVSMNLITENGTQQPQAPQEPTGSPVATTYSTLFNDIKTKDSSAQSTPQENVIYVSIGNGSSQFNTVQELTDYMDTYQQTHDVPSGIQFKYQNSSNEVVYTTN